MKLVIIGMMQCMRLPMLWTPGSCCSESGSRTEQDDGVPVWITKSQPVISHATPHR